MRTGDATSEVPSTAVLLVRVAQELDELGYPNVGIIRRGARELLLSSPPAEDACPVCGGEVVQPERGRRRTYCSPKCRHAARRRRRRGGTQVPRR